MHGHHRTRHICSAAPPFTVPSVQSCQRPAARRPRRARPHPRRPRANGDRTALHRRAPGRSFRAARRRTRAMPSRAARAVQAQWKATSFAERKRILLRFHDLVLDRAGRGPRPPPARVGEGAPARVRGGPRRRDHLPLLREHGRAAPEAAPRARGAPASDGDVGAPPPGRGGGDHRALELPADAGHLATRSRPWPPATASSSSPTARRRSRRCGRSRASRRRACPPVSCRSSPVPARSSART